METKKIKRTTMRKVKSLAELSDMELLANAFCKEKENFVEKCKYEEAAQRREKQMDILIRLKKDLTVKLADVNRIIGNYKKPRKIKFVEYGSVQDYINHATKMVDKLNNQRAGWSRTVPVEPKKAKKASKPKK